MLLLLLLLLFLLLLLPENVSECVGAMLVSYTVKSMVANLAEKL